MNEAAVQRSAWFALFGLIEEIIEEISERGSAPGAGTARNFLSGGTTAFSRLSLRAHLVSWTAGEFSGQMPSRIP